MSPGRPARARPARLVAVALVALLLPWGSAGALTGLLGPPDQGACSQSLERELGEARTYPYTEDPGAGGWRTWLVSPADVRVPPPPPELSQEHAEERRELLARALVRSEAQEAQARAWDAGPAARAWEELLLALLPAHTNVDPQMNPPRLARHLALFEAAMHDALVIAWDAKYCHQRAAPSALDPGVAAVVPPRQVPSYPSEHAVAAGVASVMLPEIFPLAPRATFESLARESVELRVWAGANWRSDVEVGHALGQEVARLALARRAHDGSAATWTGTLPEGDCIWRPTSARGPVEPLWGRVDPWLMAEGAQFRPPPPPACDGAEYVAQTTSLYQRSLSLTARDRWQAVYYDVGPGHELPPAFELWYAKNLSHDARLTTMQHARAMSYVAVAVADAGIAAWDAKYAYWGDRPIHGVHRLLNDTAWQPILRTPDFPGYVSGHATFAGAAEVVLNHLFPAEAAATTSRAIDNADSRFLGGVHITADNVVGLAVGRQVGQLAVARLQSG